MIVVLRESRGGRNERGRERAPRKAKVNRNDVDWQTYRLEVGKEHGARPGDIVGAIANEISLDSSYIGAINLHDKHSFVQLPKGIPADLFKQLKGVRVRRQPLAITASEEQVASQRPARRRNERSATTQLILVRMLTLFQKALFSAFFYASSLSIIRFD